MPVRGGDRGGGRAAHHDGFDDDLRATAADSQNDLDAARHAERAAARCDRDALERLRAGGARCSSVRSTGGSLYPPGVTSPWVRRVEGVLDVGDYRMVSRRARWSTAVDRGGAVRRRSAGRWPRRWLCPVREAGGQPRRRRSTASACSSPSACSAARLLAFLGGLVVARRAMRPISGLTKAAREVARTRNPDVRLPKPLANDEVSDLAYTLEDMLGELGAARGESEATLDRQRAFVADASHELRTPLTSILANLELLEAELDGEQKEMAGSALRSSRRMRRLVGDLLLLARADAGREAPRAPVDLAAVAREAAAEAGALAPAIPSRSTPPSPWW